MHRAQPLYKSLSYRFVGFLQRFKALQALYIAIGELAQERP